jgi:hypothetical protein
VVLQVLLAMSAMYSSKFRSVAPTDHAPAIALALRAMRGFAMTAPVAASFSSRSMSMDDSPAKAPAKNRLAPLIIRILRARGCTISVLLGAPCALHCASSGCTRACSWASRSLATAAFPGSLATSGAISIGRRSNLP